MAENIRHAPVTSSVWSDRQKHAADRQKLAGLAASLPKWREGPRKSAAKQR